MRFRVRWIEAVVEDIVVGWCGLVWAGVVEWCWMRWEGDAQGVKVEREMDATARDHFEKIMLAFRYLVADYWES